MGLEHLFWQMQQFGMGGDDMPLESGRAFAVLQKPGDFRMIRVVFSHMLQLFRQKPQSISTCSDVVEILHFFDYFL